MSSEPSDPPAPLRPSAPAVLALALGAAGLLAGVGLGVLAVSWVDGASGLAAAGALFALAGAALVGSLGLGLSILGWYGLRTGTHRAPAMAALGTAGLVAPWTQGTLLGGFVLAAAGLAVGYGWSRWIERATDRSDRGGS